MPTQTTDVLTPTEEHAATMVEPRPVWEAHKDLRRIAVGGSAIALAIVVYALRLDRVVGLVNDDGWYVLLAKALASGQGYALINSPSPGILPTYPPAFPFLLSLVFRIVPAFPENVVLLKAVSIAAMMGVGAATYFYLRRERRTAQLLAFGIALMTVLAPSFVFLATSTVMSECVFTLVQLLAVVAVERVVQAEDCRRANLYALGGGALGAFTFLTRSMGLGLIAAALLYLLRKRGLKAAVLFACACALIAGPWAIYSRAHAPTAEQQQTVNGFIVYDYAAQFWMKRAGEATSGRITARELPSRVWKNAVNIFCRDTGGILFPSLFRGVDRSGHEVLGMGTVQGDILADTRLGMAAHTMIVAGLLSALILCGWLIALRRAPTLAEILVPFSLVITVLWPWWSFRFVLPLAPFLIYYFVTSLDALGRTLSCRRWAQSIGRPGAIAHALLALVVILHVCEHASFIAARFKSPADTDWMQSFAENEEALKFMREKLPPGALVATNFPALVNLYTGHKTIFSGSPRENWERWRRLGVRYIALVGVFPMPAAADRPGLFRVIYLSPRLHLCVLEIERSS